MIEEYFGKILFDLRVCLFGFYVPVKYSNYNDVSFGDKYPCYKILYQDIFTGKSKTSLKHSGFHIDAKFVINHQKIWWNKNKKYFRYLSSDQIKMIQEMMNL